MSTPYVLSKSAPAPVAPRVPLSEYEKSEQQSEGRNEYLDGIVRAMPGAGPRHLLITPLLGQIAGSQLRQKEGSCVYLDQDVRIAIPAANTYTYPDGAIACPPEFLSMP